MSSGSNAGETIEMAAPRSSKRPRSPLSFLESRGGQSLYYHASANAAFFWSSDSVDGMIFWGRPDNTDIEMIAAALRANPALPRRQASLVDLRWLESIDLGAFGKLSSILASQRVDSYERVTRQAVLPPDGPAGAIAAAAFATLNQRCSSRSFAEASEALEWIGVRDPSLVDQLERIRGASSVCPPVVDAIRTHLDGTPASAAGEAALEIGVSQRTLQRRLRESGTSYQREVNLARLEVAKRLLRTTAHPLKWIALEAGYGSPQHFSSSFRKHMQMSPSRWRAIARNGPPRPSPAGARQRVLARRCK